MALPCYMLKVELFTNLVIKNLFCARLTIDANISVVMYCGKKIIVGRWVVITAALNTFNIANMTICGGICLSKLPCSGKNKQLLLDGNYVLNYFFSDYVNRLKKILHSKE